MNSFSFLISNLLLYLFEGFVFLLDVFLQQPDLAEGDLLVPVLHSFFLGVNEHDYVVVKLVTVVFFDLSTLLLAAA